MDRKIVIMFTVDADADLPDFVDFNEMESPVIEPIVKGILLIREGRDGYVRKPPSWKDYKVDGYSFSLKPDGNGGLQVGRNLD